MAVPSMEHILDMTNVLQSTAMAIINATFTIDGHDHVDAGRLSLPGKPVTIKATFRPGEHVFTSQDFVIGHLRLTHQEEITARLSFWYKYDQDEGMIGVCGKDFPSAKGMKLITTLAIADESSIEYTAPGAFIADNGYDNTIWNYHSQLMPGAAEYFKKIVRAAHDSLIQSLRDLDLIVGMRELLPHLDLASYHDLCTVWNPDGTPLAYDPKEHHHLQHGQIIGIPETSFAYRAHWPRADVFLNVKGSTNDPKPNKETSWNLVWTGLWGGSFPKKCFAYNYKNFGKDDTRMVGGHVVKFGQSQQPPKNKNYDKVYIIPICNAHNIRYKEQMGLTGSDDRALQLENYFGPPGGPTWWASKLATAQKHRSSAAFAEDQS